MYLQNNKTNLLRAIPTFKGKMQLQPEPVLSSTQQFESISKACLDSF